MLSFNTENFRLKDFRAVDNTGLVLLVEILLWTDFGFSLGIKSRDEFLHD